MAKEKSKINSSEDLAPPQARSLRSRKRKCPSDDVQAPHQQDAEKGNTTVVSTPQQCPRSPVQECAEITNQQDQGSEQSCAIKRGKDTGYFTNVELTEQDAANPQNNSQLEGFQVLTESDTNKSGMNEEEIGSDECQRSLHQIRTDQVQVFSPITKQSDQSCATALNAKENSDVERKQQTGPEEPINVCMDDIKDLMKESTAGLPTKKKRRMGMCGLTEKERSHFLLTHKHENGQNREDKVEKPICDNTAEPVALGKNTSSSSLPSSPPSIPAEGQNVELSEEELKLQSSHCEADEKAEGEAHGAVSPSDGPTAVCDPGCSEGKGCECEDGFVTDSEQAAHSDQLAENEVGGNLDSQTLQELKARTNEVTAEIPEKHEEDGSAEGNCSAVSFRTSRDEKSDDWDAVEAPLLQVTATRDEKKEEMSGDVVGGDGADEGASCTHTRPGGLKCGSVELREAAATPSVSERKDSRDSEEPAAGPSTAHSEHAQTLDTADSFGYGCLDYVSDSQLNTIVLIEDEMMQKDEGPDSSDCHEDATDLICGLIRELASLNRKVMATHRELESLRRSSKTSRSSTR